MSHVSNLDDVIVISCTFQKHLFKLHKIDPTVPRSLPKAQSGEVPTLAEDSTVTRAYCVT
jgi:hypothetical protein